MAAALLLGNLALLADATSQWNTLPDRCTPKTRHSDPTAAAAAASRSKRDPPLPHLSAAIPIKLFLDPDGAADPPRFTPPRRKGPVVPAAATSDGGDGGGDGGGDWEENLRRRLKDMEEMKELERTAEELQSRVAEDDGGDGPPESEEVKRERVRRELEKVAREQAERRQTAKLMFELGQKAYGRGMYGRAIEFLEGALTIIPRPTFFGGEIQIWLAMAYEANNRHRDCIELYYQLEKKHPSISIRRQASELRYILQAPKLKISKDEMVTIPLIGSSYDSYAGFWTDKYKDRGEKKMMTTNQLPSSRDFLGDFLVWRPPNGWEKNRTFWTTVILWLGLLGTALLLQR